jgi:hypothetical protein
MLDKSGTPQRWLNPEDAISYYAKKSVIWDLGDNIVVMRGGTNRATGEQTVLSSKAIVAVRGGSEKSSEGIYRTPSLNNDNLFLRDRNICAYCGTKFSNAQLTCDHVHPRKFGGKNVWTNVVSACKRCNHAKGHKILGKDTQMQLLYVPYAPTFAETLILSNRNILVDQMDFLMNFVPDSRKHLFAS